MGTTHSNDLLDPSLVLRTRDPHEREAVKARLAQDLATASSLL